MTPPSGSASDPADDTGLTYADLERFGHRFGVAADQVRRDHLISQLLVGISQSPVCDEVVFFGGTALTRTHLRDLRLSEDIDLIATGNRTSAARRLAPALERVVARTHGALRWDRTLEQTRGAESAVLRTEAGLAVRVQLVSAVGYPAWPTEVAAVEQRYIDVGPARLRTLRIESFVAAKTAAWVDRQAPRDLYDLWALAQMGAIDHTAAQLYRRHGSTGQAPSARVFHESPSDAAWLRALSHQCRVQVGPREAAGVVDAAWQPHR